MNQRETRIRLLQDKLSHAAARSPRQAIALLEELVELEPRSARWHHKLGDMLRRQDRPADAVHAYEKATTLYADYGFLARAIAMAKVLLELDPARVDVLERVDPQAARRVHRRRRPKSMRLVPGGAGDPGPEQSSGAELSNRAEPLERDPAAGDRVVGFRPPRHPSTIELELSDLELAERSPPADQAAADATDGPRVEQLAVLPLFPLFAEMPQAGLRRLARASELVRAHDGEVVVRRGDRSDALYAIVSGTARVVPPGAKGAFVRLTEGDVFGEACLLSAEPRSADVLAEGDLLCLEIPKQTLGELVRIHPGLADVMLEMMTRRLLANLLHTSRLFAGLSLSTKQRLARHFEVRRARAGLCLSEPGYHTDAIYITLTGHLEVTGEPPPSGDGTAAASNTVGAGVMFGHASALSGAPSRLRVVTRENLLLLRLPREAFASIASGAPEILFRVEQLGPLASIAA